MQLFEEEGKRARRATRFSGDFHAKFDIGSSEEEYDSDAPKKKKGRSSTGGGKTKRTKECPGCGAKHSVAVKECSFCDYQFTSKSMLMSSQSAAEESQAIRERFPFEPEREEDGSLIIQAILGRRPRQTNHRWPKMSGSVGALDSKYEFEYLIKFKNLSYLHTKWLSASEIEAMNNKSKQTLYRYLTRIDRGEIIAEDGQFDSSFIEVEKVLDVKEEEVTETVDDLAVDDVVEEDIPDEGLIKTKPSENKLKSDTAKENETNDSNGSAVHKVGSIETDLASKAVEEVNDDPSTVRSLFKIFSHVERCKAVLNRIWDDPYAISFHDPVDTDEYDDYLDIVDEPICLSDVKTKLENGEYNKYFYHVKFANDMRKIWKNCKAYNLYQSQIWYSAHALSLMFERLFQGWVVMYADGGIDINDPLGRPWESSCRVCQEDENDSDLMLCDHCDAAYHTYCLRPKLKQVPEGAWICPRCVSWFARTGKKMLSAAAEDEARQYAEGAKSRKVVKVKKKKYLVKWRGLSYKECTWETIEDINDDDRITEYHRINDNPPDEPPLTKAEIGYELSKDRKIQLLPPTRNPNPIQDLDAIIYAQIRSYHFLKWKKIPPPALLRESGPTSLAYVHGLRRPLLLENEAKEDDVKDDKNDKDKKTTDTWFIPQRTDPITCEVADHLSDMVYFLARTFQGITRDPYPARPKLPSPHYSPSEFEVCIRKRITGIGLQVGNYNGFVAVLGFRKDANIHMDKTAIDLATKVKVGDILVAIDDTYLNGLNYSEALSLMKKKSSQSNQNYIYLRFLRLSSSDEDSSDPEAIKNYFESKSNKLYLRPFPLRSLYHGVFPSPFNGSTQLWTAEYYDKNCKRIVLGEFKEEIEAAKAYDAAVRNLKNSKRILNFDLSGNRNSDALDLFNAVTKEREENADRLSRLEIPNKPKDKNEEDTENDNNSYDSRDSDTEIASESTESESDGSDIDDDKVWAGKDSDEDDDWKPKKIENLQESDGPMGRLLRAVNESDHPPARSDWNQYILDQFPLESKVQDPTKKKKILQIDMASQTVMREWDSIPEIARNLGISIIDIQQVLVNKKDTAGGFIWRYSTSIQSPGGEEINEDEIDGNGEVVKKSSNSSWKSKLYSTSKEYRSGGKLRDYQVDGLNWLLTCWYSKRSSILADEMGLGKTVQVVSFLEHLFEVEKNRGPFLVCVPLSTIQHWKREADTWTNMITCLYHDAGGGRDMRDIIREYEWYYKGHSRRLLKFQLLITTYDDLIRDYEELAEIPWRVVVVDEAHRLRNLNSKLLECMRSVVAKGMVAYGYQHRVLMTGTPLQNNTSELWTLLNFIEPAKFPSIEKFYERYGHITTQEQVESLQVRLAPHLLRRVKEDVAKDIPPKEETIIDVELTTIQKQYYRAIFEKNHSFLIQNLKGTVPKLMNIQMELRKCCNHPFLVEGVEQNEMEQLDSALAQEGITNYLPTNSRNNALGSPTKGRNTEFERRRMESFVIPTSGKMVLIDKLLPKLLKEGHKVLIFSQMVKMIDIIDEYCEFRGYSCERLDGRISGNERQKAIDRFNRDPKSFVFLLSTRAGGVGINLTAADTVIIFDSDWNPQNDVQAMARCHRIGQSKNVTIYRLITRRSFEASMFERASKKLGLEQAVLGSRQFNEVDGDESKSNNPKMDAKELEQLLKEGAYSVLYEDNSDEIKDFFDQDIEKLLEQRAHVMVAETTATESWLNKKNMKKTKKSLFTGDLAMEHAEIDVNDPDFWKKVLPDLVTPESMLERLSDENFGNSNDNDEEGADSIDKFMRDLTQMIEGMLDLKTRGQLPEKQRESCMKLLLRISLKDDVFDPVDIGTVKDWLATIEGTRRRTRTEIVGSPEAVQRTRGRGQGQASRGNSRRRSNNEGQSRRSRGRRDWQQEDEDEDNSNDDTMDEDDVVDDRGKGRGSTRGRGNGRGSRGRGKSSAKISRDMEDFIESDNDTNTDIDTDVIASGIEKIKGVLVKKKYNRKKSSALDLPVEELDPKKRKARSKAPLRDIEGDSDELPDDIDDEDIPKKPKKPRRSAQLKPKKSRVREPVDDYEDDDEEDYVTGSAGADMLVSDSDRYN